MKKYYKYILIFVFILALLIFFGSNNTDNIWNYGMAHAIRIGEIPYRDFNIITTPLYAFLMSSFLFFWDSYFVFLLEQAFLCTIFLFIIQKLISNKSRIFIFFMFFPIFYFIFPNYNFLVFLLLVLLIYLEEKKESDFYIGIVLGLLILSKHTIGVVILFCSLLSTHDWKRVFKRLIPTFILLLLFFFYLLGTNSFLSFLDLGILGLFDFGNSNKYYSIFCILTAILIFIYLIYAFVYNKSYLNYYLLGSFSFILPINDLFHMNYLFCFFILILLMRYNFSFVKPFIFNFLIITIIFLNIFVNRSLFLNMKFSNVSSFSFYLVTEERNDYINTILKRYQSYEHSYMLSINSMFFDISSSHSITYFDIPLYGNFGYDGISKMKSKINNMHDVYFFLKDNPNRQYVNVLNDYVRTIGKKIDNVEDMEIYYIS